jgi:signal-transduction protein with cAMP-binding, CBS, and nucleotidyltransferase domain
MVLDLSTVETFISEHREEMRNKVLTRHDRYRILTGLRERLDQSLCVYEASEARLSVIIQTIGAAESYDTLKELHRQAVEEVKSYFLRESTVVDVHDMFRSFRDAITSRVLTLVEDEMMDEGYGPVPVDYCWAGLGSEGRDEQTFVTDQDNLIVYSETDNDFGTDKLKAACSGYYRNPGGDGSRIGAKELLDRYFSLFSEKAVERLDFVGFNRCKGGIMPVNEKWRGSLTDWQKRLQETLAMAKESLELLDLIILIDARSIEGSVDLFAEITRNLFALLRENQAIMKELTQSAVLMPTALGFLGRFKLETSGENKGKFNIKLLGWSPLIMSVRVLALHQGLNETNTLKRIKKLREINIITKEMEGELTEAYLVFVKFRLMKQIESEGEGDLSYISPEMLGAEEASRLRRAMRAVEGFQKYINELLLFGQQSL